MEIMNDKAYIVCQAPVEVPNVLSLYEYCKDLYREIIIVSSCTDSYMRFFEYLHIKATFIEWKNCEIDFLRNVSLKKYRKNIQRNLQQTDLHNSDVYYTSRLDFFALCHFLEFPEETKFFYRGLMDDKVWKVGEAKNGRIKSHISSCLVRLRKEIFCHNRLYYYNCNSLSILGFSPKELNHRLLHSFDNEDYIIKKYKYVPKATSAKVAILYTEPYRNAFHTEEDYIYLNHEIVKKLHEKGYYVIMKGHPRIGICKEIESEVDEIIPQYVPAEFIDVKCFTLAIGFVSTALASASESIPTYSVLDLCQTTNKELALYWKDYLFNVAGDKIIYLNNFDEIK